MEYFVSVLYSVTLDLYYIGSSANPEERLKKHLTKHRGFTSKAKEWATCYIKSFKDKSEALKKERQIKSWESSKKIPELIQSGE